MTNDDNDIWGFSGDVGNQDAADVVVGSGWKHLDPFLELGDADTSNDLVTAPFSHCLDYSDTADIGATIGARRTTLYVDDGGTIDYSSVDANEP